MSDTDMQIVSFEVSNLRGYKNARLAVRDLVLLVGDNNQGKSSMLSLASWLINDADPQLLLGNRTLTELERAFLVPANRTTSRSRRFTISVAFVDGRRGRKFGQQSHTPAQLRLSVLSSANKVRLNVGVPRRGESKTEPKALELLEIIRDRCSFLLIPPVRDATPARTSELLGARIDQLLLDRFSHSQQGGALKEYRFAKKTIESLDEMLGKAGSSLWSDLKSRLPGSLARSARVGLNATTEDLADWVRSRTVLTLSTGDHDSDHVAPSQVGTGLQSTFDLALRLAHVKGQDLKSHVIAAIEEPEAFLHPAAQRDLARILRKLSHEPATSVIVATHSPYVVDEAEFGEVTLVRGQRFFAPADDPHRSEINSALMCAQAAEAFFAEGVLLVEGPSEVELFGALLKRLRSLEHRPELSRLTVLAVGGKNSFAPWYRLFSSYGREPERPVRFICLMDGDAASNSKKGPARAVLGLSSAIGLRIPDAEKQKLIAFGDDDYKNTAARLAAVRAINLYMAPNHIRLLSVDLEWAAFGGLAGTKPGPIAEILECDVPQADVEIELARRAGSKVRDGKTSSSALKHPHRRAKLAQQMDLPSLPAEIRDVMRAWVGLVIRNKTEVKKMIP